MAQANRKNLVLGFISIHASEKGLYRGGYLLVNHHARPLQFLHSSAVQISKAQRVLFGKSFEEYLFAEVFAKPLTDRQTVAPSVIAVDCESLLSLRQMIPAPVIWIRPGSSKPENDDAWEILPDEPAPSLKFSHIESEEERQSRESTVRKPFHGFQPIAHPKSAIDLAAFQKIHDMLPGFFDWFEPFERIKGVLTEVKDSTNSMAA